MTREIYYQKTIDYFDRAKDWWGLYTKTPFLIESFRFHKDLSKHIDWIIESSKIDHCQSILDCGCGFGLIQNLLSKKFPNNEFYGVTLNQLHVDHKQHSNVFLGNFEHLSYSNNSIDRILFLESFSYAFDKYKTLQEAYRVLKPGGYLFILDLCHVDVDVTRTDEYKNHFEFYGNTPIHFQNIQCGLVSVGFDICQNNSNLTNKLIIKKNQESIVISMYIIDQILPFC